MYGRASRGRRVGASPPDPQRGVEAGGATPGPAPAMASRCTSHATAAAAAVGMLLLAGCGAEPVPDKAGEIEVELCDGETSTRLPARTEYDREDGLQVASDLMAQWRRRNPDERWVEAEREKHVLEPPADNSHLIGKTQGHTYSRITEQHLAEWERELVKLVAEGSRIFHSADALGSEIAVSCDMCHPDAANTHPETYPKFQTQLGRVALLRDMINWCIEHPVRGPLLPADSPEMRALEAYILAQRSGKTLAYGKH